MFYKILRKSVYTVLWVLLPLTYVVSRKPNLWVFGTNFNGYKDNSRYLFEYVSDSEPDVKAIWISGKRTVAKAIRKDGRIAYWRYSFLGMLAALRGGAFIYCHNLNDINLWLKHGALKLNLWHGIPFKKIGEDIHSGPLKKIRHPEGLFQKVFAFLHSPHLLDKTFFLLATSKKVKTKFAKAFGIPEKQVIEFGYSRLKPFYQLNEKPKSWESFKYVALYMPTFRDGNPHFLTEAFPSPEELNETCRLNDTLFVFKLHPITSQTDLERFKGFSNIEVLPKEHEIYTSMTHTDFLITDYSSVALEYTALNKPILIYAYDLDDYQRSSRELYYDFRELFTGKIIESFSELLETLATPADFSIPLEHLKKDFWQVDNETANEDLTQWLKSKLTQTAQN